MPTDSDTQQTYTYSDGSSTVTSTSSNPSGSTDTTSGSTNPDGTGTGTGTESSSSAQTMTFPSDLDHYGHWIMFSSFKYSRENRMSETARQGSFTGYVVLPRPQNLGTEYRAHHEGENLGLGIAAIGAADLWNRGKSIHNSRILNENQKASELSKLLQEGFGDIVKNAPGLAAGLALDKFGDISQGLSVATGLARNPHLAVLFKSVQLREHNFDYNFIARDEDESTRLFQIIHHFKRSMHPSYADGYNNHLFEYPDEFQIEFDDPSYMYTFGPCVLTGCAVNYHDAGTSAYFRNKAPFAVGLRLSFLETTIITKETVESDWR